MTRLRLLGATALVAAVLLVSGCAAEDPAAAPSSSPSATASSTPEPTPTTVEPATRPADLTCETLISPELVKTFTDAGITATEDVFRIGDLELPDGLWCVWGASGSVTASVQIYGWSGIDPDEAQQARDALVAEGWILEETDTGVYVTENPDTTVATDSDGYGMTFLFRDGWVAVSDTKEGLLVIEPPA